jgi:hypothetical protein
MEEGVAMGRMEAMGGAVPWVLPLQVMRVVRQVGTRQVGMVFQAEPVARVGRLVMAVQQVQSF